MVATEFIIALRFVPTEVKPVMITTAIRAAIRPYSMAVAPFSFEIKRSNNLRIFSPQFQATCPPFDDAEAKGEVLTGFKYLAGVFYHLLGMCRKVSQPLVTRAQNARKSGTIFGLIGNLAVRSFGVGYGWYKRQGAKIGGKF